MIIKSAEFSDDGRYRYRLTRTWGAGRRLVFLMLNPSTADAERDDPTVTRCLTRAFNLGYFGVEVVNLFAFRSPYPAVMRRALDPVGRPDNDRAISNVVQVAGGPVVLAYGDDGAYRDRAEEVLALPCFGSAELLHLGLTKAGYPRHPLHVAYAVKLQKWSR